jgi:hypothetical protein
MNRPQRNSGNGARGNGSAFVKGALLIGLAVIIGIVLLQVTDDDNDSTSAATPSRTTQPKTTTTIVTTTTTTLPATPPKTNAELSLIVLNGGAPTGAAADMNTQLKQAGYTNQEAANDWEGHTQQGNTVMCKAGLDREAVALSVAVGENTPTEAFPDPGPPFSDNVDCVVVVGETAAA